MMGNRKNGVLQEDLEGDLGQGPELSTWAAALVSFMRNLVSSSAVSCSAGVSSRRRFLSRLERKREVLVVL